MHRVRPGYIEEGEGEGGKGRGKESEKILSM